MNYFVSIADSYYHEWQIKILLDSFKKLKLEDKLHIAVASNNKKYKEGNFYYLKNLGFEKEYLKYNKWYSLYALLKNENLKLPIVVLEPHMVLVKEIEEDFVSNIVYQYSNEFVYSENYIIKELNGYNKDHIKNYWFNLGDLIIFNNLDNDFFLNILQKIENYSLYLENYLNLDKISISNCIWDFASKNNSLSVDSRQDLECYLNQNKLNYFLNYRHGFKDIFNKNFYKNKDVCMSDKNLKDNIGSIRYTKCLDFFYNNIN